MRAVTIVASACVAACQSLGEVGRAPGFESLEGSRQLQAMYTLPMPERTSSDEPGQGASLWSAGHRSLLGDRRASRAGDILTVVIEIDDSAEFSNSSDHSRSGSESMGIPDFFGIPQRIGSALPDGASMDNAVGTTSNSSYRGDGSVRRNERLALRVASTVVERLPNGVLHIQGNQEVRVNYELRELIVSGYVRPEDISRQNEVTYDKIAGARISYGGRGQVTAVQQPRIGQQIADILLPF